jgi:hypothetical protein
VKLCGICDCIDDEKNAKWFWTIKRIRGDFDHEEQVNTFAGNMLEGGCMIKDI